MPTATQSARRRMAETTAGRALLVLLQLLMSGLLCVQGFFLHPAGQSARPVHTFTRPPSLPAPFFLPTATATSITTLSGGRAGSDHHHQHQQHQHHSRRHLKDKDKAGPLKALRQAVALLNSALQLVFSLGDVFGTYSSLPPNTRAPDLGRRRGGASSSSSSSSSSSGGGGPRWGRGRMLGGGLQGGADDGETEDDSEEEEVREGEEGEAVELNDLVSKRDLNSWEAWQGGNPQKQREEEQRAQRQQQRRKKMTFSTRYSCAVSVANASRLEEYMGLPFEQYSLLDQSFISRVEGKENEQGNVFRFMVPANELVGLQTVPIVDVRVDVDARKRQLSITSISSRFVARASDGTILGTQAMSLLTNNSLTFSTRILWGRSSSSKQSTIFGHQQNTKDSSDASWGAAAGSAGELGGGVPESGGNGPGANLARLRRRIFSRGGNANKAAQAQQLSDEEVKAGVGSPPEVRSDAAAARLRRLSCRANLEVGVVVPPPFSLLPGLILRQGASLILSTLVGTLVNRFLKLLIEDFHKWQDQASREASAGALLGYDPQRFDEREIEVSEADEDEDEPPFPPRAGPLLEPEYII